MVMVVDSGRLSTAGAPLLAALRWMRRRHEESPCIRVRCVKGRGAGSLFSSWLWFGSGEDGRILLRCHESKVEQQQQQQQHQQQQRCVPRCGGRKTVRGVVSSFFGFSRQDLVCSCWLVRWKMHAREARRLNENIQQEGEARKHYLA